MEVVHHYSRPLSWGQHERGGFDRSGLHVKRRMHLLASMRTRMGPWKGPFIQV